MALPLQLTVHTASIHTLGIGDAQQSFSILTDTGEKWTDWRRERRSEEKVGS